jgi:hypothetical protein
MTPGQFVILTTNDRSQMKSCIYFSISLFLFSSCTVSKKQVVGTYLNSHYGDTLHLYEDGNYEYAEQLISGKVGWTEGKWSMKKKSIIFQCDHRPLVGYRLKVRPDTLARDFQIRLTMGDTEEPIYIEDVAVYHGPVAIENSNTHADNVVKILRNDFDSIVVRTFNFRAIKFARDLKPVHAYVAEIYPIERLYELDKVPFVFHKKSLISKKTAAYPNINISFKKE